MSPFPKESREMYGRKDRKEDKLRKRLLENELMVLTGY